MPPANRKYKRPERKGPDMSTWSPEEREAVVQAERLKTPVAEMKLQVRVINTLEENDVILAEHLMAQTYDTLMGMKNLGDKTLREIRASLAALGLTAPAWKKPPKEKKPPRPKVERGKDIINLW